VDWPEDQQKYTLVTRTGSGFSVKETPGGGFTWIAVKYQALHADCEVDHGDDYTEGILATYEGKALGPPLMPGRGMGVADVPSLKIIGTTEPNDVAQGGVGDRWMLSAISGMAEFEGAIEHVFRKTDWKSMPADDFNHYTITLFDLPTWEEVDIVIDERLCSNADSRGLIGNQPSVDGELWVCYLEKAMAAHCGGWDKIDGGQCTVAWAMLTGCKDQYTMKHKDGKWKCFGSRNPNTGELDAQCNSPKDRKGGLWPMDWPKVGGGGSLPLSDDELFDDMCEWDATNYIMGAGTQAGSDTHDHQGIVDGHAYSVITCVKQAGGSEFDMVKVRNPWGQGEFKGGMWVDDGEGWDDHPEVKDALDPVQADDGVFWVSKEEFFQFFGTLYVCALDMTEFVDQ